MAAETYKIFKEAFGDNALGQTQNYKQFKYFKNGRMSVDDERSGWFSTRTKTKNVAKVREAILEDQRWTIHDICNIVGLSYGTSQWILLDDLNIQHYTAKFVPRLLNSDQKEYLIVVCTELKEQAKNDPNFISNSDDEFGCSGTSLRQSSSHLSGRLQLHHDRRKHDCSEQCQIGVGLFFDNEGILHKVQTSRQQCNNSCSLYHDNVPVHVSLVW